MLDNNAGIIIDGPLREVEANSVDKLIAVNCTGVTLGARAAYKYLKSTPDAQLVNMASASAVYGQPNIATYSATKFYVAGLTEALSLEWRHDDIRVLDICAARWCQIVSPGSLPRWLRAEANKKAGLPQGRPANQGRAFSVRPRTCSGPTSWRR